MPRPHRRTNQPSQNRRPTLEVDDARTAALRAQWEGSPALRAEISIEAYIAFRRAQANGRLGFYGAPDAVTAARIGNARKASRHAEEGLAALSLPLAAGPAPEIQLLPAGTFDASDGALMGEGPWHIDRAVAAAVISKLAQSKNDLAIDYEHQTLMAASNGQPAPAAGWICPRCLEWREGSGLWAVNVRWTDKAADMIRAREYRYISPVFSYDDTGVVTGLLAPAVTNDPALSDMAELRAAASRGALPKGGTSPELNAPWATRRVKRRFAAEMAADTARAEWEGSAALRSEISLESHIAFCRAQAAGQVRIYRRG